MIAIEAVLCIFWESELIRLPNCLGLGLVCVYGGEGIDMCRVERERSETRERDSRTRWLVMGLKTLGESRVEKLKSSMVSRPRMKLWMIRATTSVLLWTCLVQLTALGEMWGPRVLKGWPSCFSQDSAALDLKLSHTAPARVLPPKSESLTYVCVHSHIYFFIDLSIFLFFFRVGMCTRWIISFLY